MTFAEFKFLIRSDLHRIDGRTGAGDYLRQILFGEGYKYCFWLRLCQYLSSGSLTRYTLFPFARFILRHYKYKLGISISPATKIGPGLYIGHFGGIVVNGSAKIGANCNLSHGVTIGQTNRGLRKGCPVIGDNVFIGPGAMVFGNVQIGNRVAIGANSVVTKDLPDGAVAVGSPAQIVSHAGSDDYVNRTDY